MTIITWNCNMAFRRKADFILKYKPDILIVQECEHPDRLIFANHTPGPTDMLWFGKNPNKGLGIFSYSDFQLRVLDVHDDRFKMIIPITVTGKNFDFTLFAIWANNPGDPEGAYVTQVWKAIRHYDSIITNKRTVLIGDFNSNTIWDRPRREGNHSTVVKTLEAKKIYSVYHKYFDQQQGCEKHPTQFMYRWKSKPYHLDYCFASLDLVRKLKTVKVGDHDNWCKHSDHVPVIVKFDTRFLRRGR